MILPISPETGPRTLVKSVSPLLSLSAMTVLTGKFSFSSSNNSPRHFCMCSRSPSPPIFNSGRVSHV